MEKVLVVDDEEEMLTLVDTILQQDGYDTIPTSDPREALDILGKEAIDLVVTDLKMGSIDGLEIAGEAKATNKDTEVVLVTGYATLESAVSALRQGVYDYILKPFKTQELSQVVGRAAERQRMRRANVALRQKIERNLRDITMLYEIGRIINSCQDLDEVIDFVVDTMVESMNVEICSVMLLDPQEAQFKIRRAVGLSEATVQHFKIECELMESVLSLSEGEPTPIAFSHYAHLVDSIAPEDRTSLETTIYVPLKLGTSIFGFLTVHKFKDNQVFNEESARLLSIIATQVGPILKVQLERSQQESGGLGPLYLLEHAVQQAIGKAKSYRGTVSLLFLRVLPVHTEDKGRGWLECMPEISDLIQHSIGHIDLAQKIGLDTFALILPGKATVSVELFGRKLREDISQQIPLPISVILACGTYPIDGRDATTLIEKIQYALIDAERPALAPPQDA